MPYQELSVQNLGGWVADRDKFNALGKWRYLSSSLHFSSRTAFISPWSPIVVSWRGSLRNINNYHPAINDLQHQQEEIDFWFTLA